MWQLIDAVTNRVTYRNLWDQWEACKTSFHKDGTKIKKAEAMTLESGATVYRKYNVKKFFKVPVIKDGNIVDEQTRTTDVPELRPYRLEQVL